MDIGFLTCSLGKAAMFTAAALAVTAACACAAEAAWINSDVSGNVTPASKARYQDDFNLAVNHDWMVKAKIRSGEAATNSFTERNDEVEAQVMALLGDKTLKDHETVLARKFYEMLLDWKKRDSLGMSPVIPYVERINKIKNIDEMTAYLTDGKIAHFGSVLADMGTGADRKNALKYTVYIGGAGLLLTDADEYKSPKLSPSAQRLKDANDVYIPALLVRAGFSGGDAKSMNDAAFRVEKKIAAGSMGLKECYAPEAMKLTYNVRTKAELAAESPAFPLGGILDSRGYGQSRQYVLTEPKWLAALNSIYNEDNLDDIKSYLIVKTVMSASGLLDQECRTMADKRSNVVYGTRGKLPDKKYAYNMTDGYFGEELGKSYVTKYVNEKTKARTEKIISEVVSYYREMLKGETWLTEATRNKAVLKLDKLTVRAAYPDKWEDFSALDFKGADEGGTLIDAVVAVSFFERARDAKRVNTDVDRSKWEMPPQTVNAYYSFADNSINIPAGILGGVFFPPDSTAEEQLGGIGMVIGHEITHAFDTNGAQYDENGNMNDWWTENDYKEFRRRADTISDYYNGLEVFPGVKADGKLVVSEATADLGGISCMTAIGRTLKGFDFAKFYSAFARVWRLKTTKEVEEYRHKQDVHPLAFLRTNVNVQQMPEFYTAFSVSPGDGMYLAPEKRLKLW